MPYDVKCHHNSGALNKPHGNANPVCGSNKYTNINAADFLFPKPASNIYHIIKKAVHLKMQALGIIGYIMRPNSDMHFNMIKIKLVV